MRYLTKPGEPGSYLSGGHSAPWGPPRPPLQVLPDGHPDGQRAGEPGKVLITGGSSGIGAATARAFAARGFLVSVTGRDQSALARVAGETGAVAIPGDITDPGFPRRVVDAAALALGGLDVVVSNAGVGWSGPFTTMTDDDIDTVLDVNLRAAAHVARASLAHLQPELGHLIFVGSIAGLVGVAEEAWYSATKAGLAMLADVLCAELEPDGIGVTLVAPGVVNTPFFERRKVPYQRQFPRPVPAQMVAAAIVDAVTRRRETVVVPGWLAWPARLKGGFPGLYRILERSLDSRGGGRSHGRKGAPVVGSAGSWPRNAGA